MEDNFEREAEPRATSGCPECDPNGAILGLLRFQQVLDGIERTSGLMAVTPKEVADVLTAKTPLVVALESLGMPVVYPRQEVKHWLQLWREKYSEADALKGFICHAKEYFQTYKTTELRIARTN